MIEKLFKIWKNILIIICIFCVLSVLENLKIFLFLFGLTVSENSLVGLQKSQNWEKISKQNFTFVGWEWVGRHFFLHTGLLSSHEGLFTWRYSSFPDSCWRACHCGAYAFELNIIIVHIRLQALNKSRLRSLLLHVELAVERLHEFTDLRARVRCRLPHGVQERVQLLQTYRRAAAFHLRVRPNNRPCCTASHSRCSCVHCTVQ